MTVCCELIVAGAAYNPAALIVPGAPDGIDHVTAVLLVLVTVAANICVCPPYKVAVVGTSVTDTGGESVTMAVADLLVYAARGALTVTVCCVAILAGAVYSPVASIVPAPGETNDH